MTEQTLPEMAEKPDRVIESGINATPAEPEVDETWWAAYQKRQEEHKNNGDQIIMAILKTTLNGQQFLTLEMAKTIAINLMPHAGKMENWEVVNYIKNL